jgi:lambda repressor-like predicted transcriptional regulator
MAASVSQTVLSAFVGLQASMLQLVRGAGWLVVKLVLAAVLGVLPVQRWAARTGF